MKKVRMLAIDLGASGGKCFAGFIENNRFYMEEIHRFEHEPVRFCVEHNGRTEWRLYWDDMLIYRNILYAIERYGKKYGRELDSIGIDAWGADGMLVSATGDVIGRMYCYRDHRLDNMIERVKKMMEPRTLYEITGIHFQPFNMSNQLVWLKENRPELILPGAVVLPVPSLFYYYLGGIRFVDSTWASVTQLMDARKKCWSNKVLEQLGIPASILPPIVEPGCVTGTLLSELAGALGVTPAKLIATASHDTASAFAAVPAENIQDALIISSGTWSLIGKLVPSPITTDEAMRLNISNEGGIGNIRCLKNCMGTWLVQELRRAWRIADGREIEWAELNRLTEEAPAFTALIDPDDPSFYNPSNMQSAIEAFCRRTGQRVPATRGEFLRTVYESLALKYRMVNEQISRVTGYNTKVVHIVSGGARNIMLNQFTADAMNLPVIAGPEEATAVGNLLVQALGLGVIGSLHDGVRIVREAFPVSKYEPRDPDRWEDAYERFVKIFAG